MNTMAPPEARASSLSEVHQTKILANVSEAHRSPKVRWGQVQGL